MLTLITFIVFASVALLTGVVLYPLMSKQEVVRQRLAKLESRQQGAAALVSAPEKWQKFLGDLGAKLQVEPADFRKYRESLTAAGFRKEAVYVFLGAKFFLGLALPAGYLLLALPQGGIAGSTKILMAACLAVAGYLLPTLWVDHRAKTRKTAVFHAIPDVLDLLTVCVEAGLGLDAALVKTTENFQGRRSPLIEELDLVILEISAGRPRSEALRGLAKRTKVDDLKALVSMLVQTEKLGTSLGKTLRIYSDSLRTKRRQMAEERAAKTSVKMLFPLTFCIFPALMVVMLVPAFFKIFNLLKRFQH